MSNHRFQTRRIILKTSHTSGKKKHSSLALVKTISSYHLRLSLGTLHQDLHLPQAPCTHGTSRRFPQITIRSHTNHMDRSHPLLLIAFVNFGAENYF